MEVHRHSHSGHDNKKWTHYFWEFFMLFLAVMAGFLVENWREHYIEHKRAKVLAASIYSDIKKDTAALADIIAFSNDKFVNIERLQQELRKYPREKNDSLLIRYAFWLTRYQGLTRTKATYEQVKHSGMLRYFDPTVVNLLTEYDAMAEDANLRENGEYQIVINRIVPYLQDICNFEAVYAIAFEKPLPGNLYFNITDSSVSNRLDNMSAGIKINRTRLKLQHERMLEQALRVLKGLEEEYGLE